MKATRQPVTVVFDDNRNPRQQGMIRRYHSKVIIEVTSDRDEPFHGRPHSYSYNTSPDDEVPITTIYSFKQTFIHNRWCCRMTVDAPERRDGERA